MTSFERLESSTHVTYRRRTPGYTDRCLTYLTSLFPPITLSLLSCSFQT
jgi:hypothetical protein